MGHRYQAIGRWSPLLRWSREQAAALERLMGIRVFVGMPNWHPLIRETMDCVRSMDRLAIICLAQQFSEISVGLCIKRTEETQQQASVTAQLSWPKSYHDEPFLIGAFAERLRPIAPGRQVLFTAHSLPEKAVAPADPYNRETRATAVVAARTGLSNWDFAYQSQGMTGDAWVRPTVESRLDAYAARGIREVVIHPIAFVCDHVEILYDIDIAFRHYAAARGITIYRPTSLNGWPVFTAALAEVATRCLA